MKTLALRIFMSFMVVFGILVFAAPASHAAISTAASPQDRLWIANSSVYASAVGPDGTVYIGGNFSRLGQYLGNAIPMSTSTGAKLPTFPKVQGTVNAVISDGADGWFVGGDFTLIGTTTRNYLGHIKSDGTLDASWNPNADNSVDALLLSGTTLYVGGDFTTIGGQSRNRIAALDTSTGNASSWNPNANNTVLSLLLSGTTLYVAGEFHSIGGQARNHIVALDTSTGNALSWDPDASTIVRTMALSGTTLYVGGDFSTIGGQSRKRLAALETTTGNATSWDPNTIAGASDKVYSIAFSGTTLYVGGSFGSMGVESRGRLAAFDTTSGSLLSWNPNITSGSSARVDALAISGSTVYVGGQFAVIDGKDRSNLAAVDATTGAASTWDPYAWDEVKALAISGTTLYVGGALPSIGGQERKWLGAINPTTGEATSWDPSANSTVNALSVSGSTVYAGGMFSEIGGKTRNRIAAIDASTGAVSTWNPNADAQVASLTVSGTTLYAGGQFTTIGGQSRNRIAALDTTSGNASAWNPNADSTVKTLLLSGTTLYAGGQFTTIGGQSRNRIAALDTTSGNASAWNPNASNTVTAFAITGTTLYVGGAFTTIGGQSRNGIAALDTATGNANSWDALSVGADVYAILIQGSTLYVGGNFATMGGQTRNYLAALDTATGTATTWNPNASDDIRTLTAYGSTLFVGGDFSSISSASRWMFAGYDMSSVQFSSSTASGWESATSPTITITLNFAVASDVTVAYAVTGGTASKGSDYTLASGTATIPAGSLTVTIPLKIVDDSRNEKDETIIITLSNPTSALLGATAAYTYTIKDNDTNISAANLKNGIYSFKSGSKTITMRPFETKYKGRTLGRKIEFDNPATFIYVFVANDAYNWNSIKVYNSTGKMIQNIKVYGSYAKYGLNATTFVQPNANKAYLVVGHKRNGITARVYELTSKGIVPRLSLATRAPSGARGTIIVSFFKTYSDSYGIVTMMTRSPRTLKVWKYNAAKNTYTQDKSYNMKRFTVVGDSIKFK